MGNHKAADVPVYRLTKLCHYHAEAFFLVLPHHHVYVFVVDVHVALLSFSLVKRNLVAYVVHGGMACFLYVIAFMIVSPYFIYVNIIFIWSSSFERSIYMTRTDRESLMWNVLFLVLGNLAFVGTNIIRYRRPLSVTIFLYKCCCLKMVRCLCGL